MRPARAVAWLIPAIGVVIAVGAWGYYAWRFGVPGNLPAAQEQQSLTAPSAIPQDRSPDDADRRPSLGSTQITGEPADGVTVNTPGTYREQPEIKLKLSDRATAAEPLADATVTERSSESSPTPAAAAESPSMPPPSSTSRDLDAARDALARGDLPAARIAFSAVLSQTPTPADEALARAELERISDALLFSRAGNLNDPLTAVHVVAGGESVSVVARQFKITETLLVKLNRIANPHHLVAGQRLKVIRGPFNAVIDKSRHQMDVYLGDVYIRGYKVGLGANDGTPRGTWVVRNKLTNPEWIDPVTRHHYAADDPENPIGEHWIGMHCVQGECMGRTGFGLHGTIDPGSIGRNSSMGCIRMQPEDIAFVYDLFLEEASRIVVK